MKKKWMLPLMGMFMALSIVGCGKENKTEIPETESAAEETQKVVETVSENEVEVAVSEDAVEVIEPTVSESVVEEVAPVVDANVYGVVACEPVVKYANKSLNVRVMPSTDGELVGTAVTNTEITVIGTTSASGYEGWSQVEYNGVVAFIKSTLLSDKKVKVSNTSNTSGSGSSSNSGGGAPAGNGGLDMSGLGAGGSGGDGNFGSNGGSNGVGAGIGVY